MAMNRIIIYLTLFIISVNCNNESQENLNDQYKSQVSILVNEIQKIYIKNHIIKTADLLDAHLQDNNKTELNLYVQTECNNPSKKCYTDIDCTGIVINSEKENYHLKSMVCRPRETDIEDYAGEPVEEEIIIPTKISRLGGVHNLEPNLGRFKYFTDLALKHIESERNHKYAVLQLLKAQYEITSGINYYLTLEIAQTNCLKTTYDISSCKTLPQHSQICKVDLYSNKSPYNKFQILYNNCTIHYVFNDDTFSSGNDQDNEIDRNYPGNTDGHLEKTDEINYDLIAEGNVDDVFGGSIMDSARMKDLESQIITFKPKVEKNTELDEFLDRFKRSDSSSSSSSSSDDDDDDDDNNNNEHNKRKHKKYKNNNDNDDNDTSSSSSSEENDNNDEKKMQKKAKREAAQSIETRQRRAVSSEESTETVNGTNQISSEESSEEHRGGVRRKRSTQELIKVSAEEKNFVANLADFSAQTLDEIDSDNHKRIVLQVLGAKKNNKQSMYFLTLRVGVSKCLEENKEIDLESIHKKDEKCIDDLFENLTKICKVQIRVDENNPKVEKSHCQNIKKDVADDSQLNRTNRSKRGGERLAGGINSVSPTDTKMIEYAKNILKELDSNEGSPNKRTFIKILSASRQIVSGTRYRFKLELTEHGSNIICEFDVWDQPWLKEESKKISVKCDGRNKENYRFKRSNGGENIGRFNKNDYDIHIGIFKSYMKKFGKTYDSKTEFKKRFRIFRENMKTMKLLNDNEQGTAKYGPTIFADLSKEEYKSYLGLRSDLHDPNNIPMPQARIPNVQLPPEFDWRTKGVISEVKDQGQCGSCWAFSVTGNIEGINAIKTGNLVELSEQELVDCDKLDSGCNGGLPDNAYRAIEQLGGLESETDYPYEAEDEKCHFNKTLSRVQISGAVNISSNETDMAKWLVKNGPMSIGINANAMQFYMGGVSHPWKFLCDPKDLDHGVLIVGYGVHKYPLFNKVLPYWIVKNSWGKRWGEQGYYRVFRGDGTCGVNQMASSALM